MTTSEAGGALRVLHVSEVSWGGVVTLLKHFAAQQSAAGHDVHLLAPPPMPDLPGSVRHSWAAERGRPATYRLAVSQLRALVREIRPDVVHLHSFLAGFFGRLPGVLQRRPGHPAVVYQPHAWSFDLFDNVMARQAIRAWERRAAERTDVLVANCWDEVEEGRSAGIRLPAHELGVAVDLSTYHGVDEEERQRQRNRLGIEGHSIVVCLGRIIRQKGQDLLLPSWESRPPPESTLVLVGPGDTDTLSRLAPTQWQKSVVAVGEQQDVRPWLWASDLLVLPSRYETVGLVVAEAMACARPVVASAVNGSRATVLEGPPGPAGSVVEIGDGAAMVDQVTARVADLEATRREGMVARARAERLFDPRTVAARLDRAYRAAIGSVSTDRPIA